MHQHEKDVGYQLRELGIYIKRYIESVDRDEEFQQMRGIQMWALHYLLNHQHETVVQKDLEENLSVRKSTASKLIERMLKHELVETNISPQDRRKKEIHITEKGIAFLENAHEMKKKMEADLRKNLTDDEVEQLLIIINKIKDAIKIEE